MYVSIAIVRALVDELKRRGAARDFLDRSGIDPELLADATARIPVARYTEIVELALEASGQDALGLHAGDAAHVGMLHVVGHLLSTATTLREAIALFTQYAPLVFESARFSLHETGDSATVRYEHAELSGPVARVEAELCLSVLFALGRRFTSSDTPPRVVRFRHLEPAHVAEYARVFRAPVVFGAPANEIVFARRALDVRQIHGDESVCALLRQRADQLLAARDSEDRLPDRIRDLLRYEPDLASIEMSSVATRLGIHARSLQRRLKERGLSLSGLVDEAKRDVACSLLALPEVPVKDVAYRLGFSEPSAFHRAFKRWTHTTPVRYRERAIASLQASA